MTILSKPAILSGANDSRSESLAESKDPYCLGPVRAIARHSPALSTKRTEKAAVETIAASTHNP